MEAKEQFLQFHLPLADGRAMLLLVMVPIRDLSLAADGTLVEPRGLVAGGGGRRLCDALRPSIVS